MSTCHALLLLRFSRKAFFIGKSHKFSMDICAGGAKKAPLCQTERGFRFYRNIFYKWPHCLPVKNRSVVVARNTLPAYSTVDGNWVKLGEQG